MNRMVETYGINLEWHAFKEIDKNWLIKMGVFEREIKKRLIFFHEIASIFSR